jgi:hypothetical protein
VHFKYYLDNTAACLGLIDGKVLSSEKVLEKKRQKKVRAARDSCIRALLPCLPFPLSLLR